MTTDSDQKGEEWKKKEEEEKEKEEEEKEKGKEKEKKKKKRKTRRKNLEGLKEHEKHLSDVGVSIVCDKKTGKLTFVKGGTSKKC